MKDGGKMKTRETSDDEFEEKTKIEITEAYYSRGKERVVCIEAREPQFLQHWDEETNTGGYRAQGKGRSPKVSNGGP